MTDTNPAITMRAVDAYRNQARFQMVCQSILARVLNENKDRLRSLEENPHDVCETVHDIALSVAALVLQTVYENDAELRYWKEIAEKLVDLHHEVAMLSSSPMFIPLPTIEGETR